MENVVYMKVETNLSSSLLLLLFSSIEVRERNIYNIEPINLPQSFGTLKLELH